MMRARAIVGLAVLVLLPPMVSLSPTAKGQTPAPVPAVQNLTLHDAEMIALQNHPHIQAIQGLAAAAQQQVRETRSAYFPNIYGSLTGVEAERDSRIAAGVLNNPIIYDRYANGFTVNQLVTDFGRTHELSKSADLHAQSAQADVVLSRADVLLGADEAYFDSLRAQAVLQVAQETVKDRQLVVDQVTAMFKSQLKSQLDVTFASVDLSQAQLLLIQTQNDLQASFARLATALGYPDQRSFRLADEPLPPAPPLDPAPLVNEALQNQPQLVSERLNAQSAATYATAERDLLLPTVSAVGTAGLTPFRQDQLASRYAAAGFNVNIPIFNGNLFTALHTEAQERALAAQQNLRDLQDSVVRDVRTAWLNANSSYQSLAVTDQLLQQADLSVKLAQARYNLGLSSIVELTQSLLNQTQAQIAQASAHYDYQTRTAMLNYALGRLR